MYVREDFEIAREAIAANLFDTSLFITKVIPMDDIKEAMNIVDQKLENVIKVLLKF
jgi:L-iditol 2-dehydrogenase